MESKCINIQLSYSLSGSSKAGGKKEIKKREYDIKKIPRSTNKPRYTVPLFPPLPPLLLTINTVAPTAAAATTITTTTTTTATTKIFTRSIANSIFNELNTKISEFFLSNHSPLYVKANPEIPMQAEMYISAKCSTTDITNETDTSTSIADQTTLAMNTDMTVMGERIPASTVSEELERRKRYHVSDTSSDDEFSEDDEERVSILRKIRRREQRFGKKVPFQHTQ